MAEDVAISGREGNLRRRAPTKYGDDQAQDSHAGDTPTVAPLPRSFGAWGGSFLGNTIWAIGRLATSQLLRHRQLVFDVCAVTAAAIEVFLDPPRSQQPTYTYVLCAAACLALVWRRRYPLIVTLVTFPGWLTGWTQIAAVIALYTLAKSRPPGWKLVLGAALVWAGQYVLWPPDKFFALSVGRHIARFIRGGMMSGLPVALGLLMTTRQDLSRRIAELAASRDRERRLNIQAVRTEERARLAREMHDLVSHQVTLIAMQAGGLQVSTTEPESQRVAATIRQLSTRTLDELRQLVGLLRATQDLPQPGIDDLDDLVRGSGVDVTLDVDFSCEPVPPAVSNAIYRIVQEALTNVGKHAPGARARVHITEDGQDLRVTVSNEPPSQGSSPPVPSGGHGLIGLRERATLLGGSFEADATADGGFTVTVTFPIARTPRPRPASDPVTQRQD